MTMKPKSKQPTTARTRIRSEIVEIAQSLNKVGAMSDAELEKTTIKMMGRGAFAKITPLSPTEIAKLREKAGISQAVMAGYMNVAVTTVSQWERGERRPTGTALKLLHVIKTKGLQPLR